MFDVFYSFDKRLNLFWLDLDCLMSHLNHDYSKMSLTQLDSDDQSVLFN